MLRLKRYIFISALFIVYGFQVSPVFSQMPRAFSMENPAAVAISTSSTNVLAAKEDRRILILVNDSDTTIYCTLDSTPAVVGRGVRLNSNGGTLFMDTAVPTGAINCINGSGSKNLIPIQG